MLNYTQLWSNGENFPIEVKVQVVVASFLVALVLYSYSYFKSKKSQRGID